MAARTVYLVRVLHSDYPGVIPVGAQCWARRSTAGSGYMLKPHAWDTRDDAGLYFLPEELEVVQSAVDFGNVGDVVILPDPLERVPGYDPDA